MDRRVAGGTVARAKPLQGRPGGSVTTASEACEDLRQHIDEMLSLARAWQAAEAAAFAALDAADGSAPRAVARSERLAAELHELSADVASLAADAIDHRAPLRVSLELAVEEIETTGGLGDDTLAALAAAAHTLSPEDSSASEHRQ